MPARRDSRQWHALVSVSTLGDRVAYLRRKGRNTALNVSSHDIQIIGNNLRSLFFALQEFAVKWVRPIPERYLAFETGDDGVILEVRIEETEE